ncbi:unnamed protein product [Sphagnum balticum]
MKKDTSTTTTQSAELPIEVIIDTYTCHLNSSNSSDLNKETSTTTALNKDTYIATEQSTEPPTEDTNSIVEPIYSSTAPGDFWSQRLPKDPNHVETANEEEACFHFVQRIHP